MADNLFVLCGPLGSADVRRVKISAGVQSQLAPLFSAQEAAFRDGVDEEIPFTQSWKPDEDQLFTLSIDEDLEMVEDQIKAGPLSLAEISANDFENEEIRAIFFAFDSPFRIAIQYFSAQQRLSRKSLAFINDGDTFTKLEGPAFSLSAKIDGIIEGGFLKFKNFNIIRRIFKLFHHYEVSSDKQIETFCDHANLSVENSDLIISISNQTIRKLVSAVVNSNVLDSNTVPDICTAASAFGITISTESDRIILPTDRQSLKKLLMFLDNGIYESPLGGGRFIANSKRPLM